MLRALTLIAPVASLLALGLSSCAGTPAEDDAACSAVASLCHASELVSADAAACHEQAHEGDPAVCAEIEQECIALCESLLGLGGAGGQGGAHSH